LAQAFASRYYRLGVFGRIPRPSQYSENCNFIYNCRVSVSASSMGDAHKQFQKQIKGPETVPSSLGDLSAVNQVVCKSEESEQAAGARSDVHGGGVDAVLPSASAFPSKEELLASQNQLEAERRELYQQICQWDSSFGSAQRADGIDAEVQNHEKQACSQQRNPSAATLMQEVCSQQIKLNCIAMIVDRNRVLWGEARRESQHPDERLRHVGLGSATATLKPLVEDLLEKAKHGAPDDLKQLLAELDFHIHLLVDSIISEAQPGDAEVGLPATVWIDSGFRDLVVLCRAGLSAAAQGSPGAKEDNRGQEVSGSDLMKQLKSAQVKLYSLASAFDGRAGAVAAQSSGAHHEALDHTGSLSPVLPALARRVESLVVQAAQADNATGYFETLLDDLKFHAHVLRDLYACMS